MTTARLLFSTILLAVLASCADRTLTGPRPDLARGGPGGPTVTATSPTGAELATTLDVRVFGTNFDEGSRAELGLDGAVGPNVRTNSTRYVSSTELVANITIAAAADTGLYDVMVTASTGKKGIGTELFKVQKSPPGNPEPPPPVVPSNWTYRDLDGGAAGMTNSMAWGVSAAGWAFVSPSEWSSPGMVYRTDQTPMAIEGLPGRVGGDGAGNPRGDYLTYPDRLMMRDVSGTWSLSDPFTHPPGWVGGYANRVNDALLVVGLYTYEGRSYLTKQGSRIYYDTPIAWQLNDDGTTREIFLLNLPVPSSGCKLTHVRAHGVNLSGRIVGLAYQEAITRDAVCPYRALFWDPPHGSTMPRDLAPSPDPMKDPYAVGKSGYTLWYGAEDINDAGDVVGWVMSNSGAPDGKRAVRWMRDRYTRPEVLTGWSVVGMGIDECGRVLVGGVYIGTVGVWLPNTDAKLELPMPDGWFARQVWAIRNGRVVGTGRPAGSNDWHPFMWTLDPCSGL